MFQHILVPLDGSTLAESALPGAIWFSRVFHARITLLHLIERNAPVEVHGERHLTSEPAALAYLQATAGAFPADIQVDFHVHTEEVSSVARSIAQHAGELPQALVVMCSHGSGGLRRLMVGTIAQQIIGYKATPVLLIQPQRDQATLFEHIGRLLVALDDDPEHACGLELAGMIAQRAGAGLRLVNVVPTLGSLRGEKAAAGKLLPAATRVLLEIQQEEALDMLSERAQPWRMKGLDITCQVRRGSPAEQIARAASETNSSLIVIGTHGKAGMDAFWAGSVAPQVPGFTDLPLLLAPTCLTFA